jgi:hypothetical protein
LPPSLAHRTATRRASDQIKQRTGPRVSVDRDPAWSCHNHFRATKTAKPSARCALLFWSATPAHWSRAASAHVDRAALGAGRIGFIPSTPY